MFPSKHYCKFRLVFLVGAEITHVTFKKAITVSPLIKVGVADRDVLLVYEMEAMLFSPHEALLLRDESICDVLHTGKHIPKTH